MMYGLDLCEYCKVRPATEWHHCLIHRRKGHPELDHRYNMEHVCQKCHQSGEVNSYKHRQEFWQRQCKKYGDAEMRSWYDSLDLKHKQKF